MTPPTNISAISSQQRPTQRVAWRRPVTKAAAVPPCQSAAEDGVGARRAARQAALSGVSWYAPAAIRSMPPAAGFAALAPGASSPAACRPQCASAASALIIVHSARCPARNAGGARAAGTITATIIAAHMPNISHPCPALHSAAAPRLQSERCAPPSTSITATPLKTSSLSRPARMRTGASAFPPSARILTCM